MSNGIARPNSCARRDEANTINRDFLYFLRSGTNQLQENLLVGVEETLLGRMKVTFSSRCDIKSLKGVFVNLLRMRIDN